jgi:hypothetical protein
MGEERPKNLQKKGSYHRKRRTVSGETTSDTEHSQHSDVEDIPVRHQAPEVKVHRKMSLFRTLCGCNSVRLMVLVVLSLQNSMFTVLRRYSQGVLKETYSKYEVLLVGEVIKMVFSAYMINGALEDGDQEGGAGKDITGRLRYLVQNSQKMFGLALIYGAMNILSFVSLRNIGAGMFTIFAQCKILTTATFSTIILRRKYSWAKWRALIALSFGVLLFSEPIWNNADNLLSKNSEANVFLGVAAVLIEVTLSGFASIYFEKVIKLDPLKLSIWERNFQLALVGTKWDLGEASRSPILATHMDRSQSTLAQHRGVFRFILCSLLPTVAVKLVSSVAGHRWLLWSPA